jgi:uncharacterized protein (TIGR02246 family)
MRSSSVPNARDAEQAARSLYADILRCWNEGNAAAFAALFVRQGNVVGFDGSQVDGQDKIESHLAQIFAHHQTAAYVGKVREVRLLGSEVVLLRAVAGMVPPTQSDLNPDLNTIHTLVAYRQRDQWRAELFQSTPAAFHGRLEAREALTKELRKELKAAT